jgi:hypothetical protein
MHADFGRIIAMCDQGVSSMNGVFFNASGVDANDGAKIVFVWCRDRGPGGYALLGSGHLVSAIVSALPPGISPGQFSVTFPLPPGRSAHDVFVTDDKAGGEHLAGVTITPCSGASGFGFANATALNSPS